MKRRSRGGALDGASLYAALDESRRTIREGVHPRATAFRLALLLWSARDAGADLAHWLGARDAAFSARFDLSCRGTLLLGVVDSLADWVEAAKAPPHAAQARAAKEAHHRWSLARYRALHG